MPATSAAAIQGMKSTIAVFQQSREERRIIDRPDLLVPFGELATQPRRAAPNQAVAE